MSTSALKIAPFQMNSIKQWEDAGIFADCLVAFEPSTCYYGSEIRFCLTPGSTLKFAFIARQLMSYSSNTADMYRLIEFDRAASNCVLTKEGLLENPLTIRQAYSEEVHAIAKAIISRKARFEYINSSEFIKIKNILERQLLHNHPRDRNLILQTTLSPVMLKDLISIVSIVEDYLAEDLPVPRPQICGL